MQDNSRCHIYGYLEPADLARSVRSVQIWQAPRVPETQYLYLTPVDGVIVLTSFG